MIATVARWQTLRWWRHAPGRNGLIGLVASTLVLLAPLGNSFGLFSSWQEGAQAVVLIFPIVYAASLGRDSGKLGGPATWLFHRGAPLVDIYLMRWLLDLALIVAAVALLMLAYIAGALIHVGTVAPADVLQRMLAALASALVVHAFLFVPSAAGMERGSDLLVLLILLGFVEALITFLVSESFGRVLHVFLPPVLDATRIDDLLGAGNLQGLLHTAVHVLTWCTVCLGVGIALVNRWVPRATTARV